jgi:hypothetical protein
MVKTPITSRSDKPIIIKTPLDMEGTILVFLRNMFKAEIIPGLKWHPIKAQSQISIEVADKINQETFNAYPALFVSIGSLSFQTVGLGDGIESVIQGVSRVIPEGGVDRAIARQTTAKQTITLQQFPAKITVYSSKTEAYVTAYKVTKLMMSFHGALKNYSNLYDMKNLVLSPPVHRTDIATEIYSCDITFSCSFFDQDILLDVAPFLRQAYITVRTAQSNGTDVTSTEFWLDTAQDLEPPVADQ